MEVEGAPTTSVGAQSADYVVYRRSTGEYIEDSDPAAILAQMREVGGDWSVQNPLARLSEEDLDELAREATEHLFDLLCANDRPSVWSRAADNALKHEQPDGVVFNLVVHVHQKRPIAGRPS